MSIKNTLFFEGITTGNSEATWGITSIASRHYPSQRSTNFGQRPSHTKQRSRNSGA